MQGAKEHRLRRISNTPQGEAIDGNAADDALMVDQGRDMALLTTRAPSDTRTPVEIRVQSSTLSSVRPVFDPEAQTRRELTAEGRPKGGLGFGSLHRCEVY